MNKFLLFGLLSLVIILVSYKALRKPGSHGFYRFIAWEFMAGLFVINYQFWFIDPLSWHQVISWVLLILSLFPLGFGTYALIKRGKPDAQRQDESGLFTFEKTTHLLTDGVYRYIRHPLYGSLLLLTWAIFFKAPGLLGALLAAGATVYLYQTARADESECIAYFGASYKEYMNRSKMFIPYLF